MNNRALEEVEKLIALNNRLLELCIYALIRDTPIYKHELATPTKLKFMNIIMENLDDDTGTLKDKLLYQWNLKGHIKKDDLLNMRW